MKKQRKRPDSPFAKNLIRLMTEKGLGVREAAQLSGVAASTIMSWRSGALPENYIAVNKLAKAMGTTMSFLLVGEHDIKEDASAITEVFDDGGLWFDGYAQIKIQKLIPRTKNGRKK